MKTRLSAVCVRKMSLPHFWQIVKFSDFFCLSNFICLANNEADSFLIEACLPCQ